VVRLLQNFAHITFTDNVNKYCKFGDCMISTFSCSIYCD